MHRNQEAGKYCEDYEQAGQGGEDCVGASSCWKNEVTFNIAANHVAKTKVQESDSS